MASVLLRVPVEIRVLSPIRQGRSLLQSPEVHTWLGEERTTCSHHLSTTVQQRGAADLSVSVDDNNA